MESEKQNTFLASGRFEEITDEQATEIPLGKYLVIETNFADLTRIKLEEFMSKINEAKENQKKLNEFNDLQDIDNLGLVSNPIKKIIDRPDFSLIMEFILGQISFDFKKINNKLKIRSEESIFLELPWENIVNNEVLIIREVISNKKQTIYSKENNLLLITSSSRLYNGGELPPIKEKSDEEIQQIYKLIGKIKENETPSRFKFFSIFFVLHATKKYINNFIKWENFNYVHMIMHGLEDGKLCLEDPLNHEIVDPMSVSDFLLALKSGSFKLFFPSFCYSGGGVNNGESISFQIVKSGISQYAIGYSYPVGDLSAKIFTEVFYSILLNGAINDEKEDNIEVSYKESLKKYYLSRSDNRYIPFLYVNK